MRELIDYKDQIVLKLISNSEIVSLIDKSKINNPIQLIDTNIFDREYVPKKPEDENTFIGIETFISEPVEESIKVMGVTIVVLTHERLLRVVGKNGNRVDNLVACIWEELNKGRTFGIGKLRLQDVVPIRPSNAPDYYGKVMSYLCSDFT